MPPRSYDDEQLVRAVASSRSWREVLRRLGLVATSAAAARSVRRQADRLGLDHSHFTAGRRWTDEQLTVAVSGSSSWSEVAARLHLAGGSGSRALKGHAARLGLDVSHLSAVGRAVDDVPTPDLVHLPRAGALLAASWFVLSGHDVSWPLEPCPYDLVVHRGGTVSRVQVKTTRHLGSGSWIVNVRSSGRRSPPYDPDDLDQFFVIDGELGHYLIPVSVVAGRQSLNLRSYAAYAVPRDPVRTTSPEVP